MKLELPLAILMLAIGGMLWIYQQSRLPTVEMASKDAVVTDEKASNTRQTFKTTPDHFHLVSEIAQASYNEPERPQFQFPDFSPAQNEPGNLLVQAANNLNHSPPIACKTRCEVSMFGQVVKGHGRYLHAGQGSGKTRLEMNFNIQDEVTFQSAQICDGQFYYWIQQLNDQRRIEFIDLQELKSKQFDAGTGPTQWLTRTGTVSLLRNLSSAFEFQPAEKTKLGGLDMVHLRGTWKPPALVNMLYGQVHPLDENGKIDWTRLPTQIPHSVDVFLGTDDFLPMFPYRIAFSKFDSQGNRSESLVTIEMFEVEKVSDIPNHLFQVDTDDSRQIDLSGDYVQRLEYMVESASAAASQRR